MRSNLLTAALGLTLGVALAAAPADAQGKSKANKGGQGARARVEQADRRNANDRVYDDRAYDDRVYGDRRVDDYGYGGVARGNGAGKVPPGWCQGVGNPHNTPENCGYSASRRGQDRVGGYPGGYAGGSYEMEHQDFHRYLDRKYSDLAARRRTDIAYQLQLRMEKQAEHNRWHEQIGIRH